MAESVYERQRLVEDYFDQTSQYWADLYSREDLNAELYRQRERATLALFRSIGLSGDSRVLEVGCGAGRLSVSMAEAGVPVHAIDSTPEMVRAVRTLASDRGVSHRVWARSGDVHNLVFEDDWFDLVVAIGVLEWTPTLDQPLAEMCRVLKPGGRLIVNIDNAWALHCLVDPLRNPHLNRLKGWLVSAAESRGWRRPEARPNRRWRGELDSALERAGLTLERRVTGGFGPYTFAGCRLLSGNMSLRVHRALQDWADRGAPHLRWGGETYLTLSRKARPVA